MTWERLFPTLFSGWGNLKFNGTEPTVLQEVSVPVVAKATCRAAYGQDVSTLQL